MKQPIVHYYNDNGPYAIPTVRGLLNHDLLVAKSRTVIVTNPYDIRYITEESYGLKEATQCHWFCGMGGWTRALQIAGWKDEWPIWTASCPCQPFSGTGPRTGKRDPRHVWPHLLRLVGTLRPPLVVGEQVASILGLDWFDGVCSDLEGIDYSCRAVSIPACAVNAPHERSRLWWVAIPKSKRFEEWAAGVSETRGSGVIAMADATGAGRKERETRSGQSCSLLTPSAGGGDSLWSSWDIIGPDSDGRYRRIEPGLSPVAYGVHGRVGKLHSLGNAIVPQVGAVVIQSLMEAYGLV